MTVYNIRIETPNDIPHDVLVEHIAVALETLVRRPAPLKIQVIHHLQESPAWHLGDTVVRNHPFEGNIETFDDYPGGIDDVNDPFPLTTRAIDNLKGNR
jgi:hypothetical protein